MAGVHDRAIVDGIIGARTTVWANAHVCDGATVGDDCNIGEGVFVESGAIVGDRVTIKNHALIWNGVTIGDDVFVGPGVVFTNDRFPRSERSGSDRDWLAPTVVESGAAIGANSTIICGVTIGAGALVGAGSVVTRDVSPGAVVAGNPARPLRAKE